MSRVGVVFGGRSVEHEVSVASARTVARGLAAAGHEVVPLGIGPGGRWLDRSPCESALRGEFDRLPEGGEPEGSGPIAASLRRLLEAAPEVIFPLVHGTWGEDGTLQGLCEILDLPYVGAGVTASAVAMDKWLAKRVLEAAGVPVVESRGVRRGDFEADPAAFLSRCEELPLPLFVKPAVGGSSVGIRKVAERACLETAVRFALRFDDAVIVERGVEGGRELECAVLGYPRLEASVVGEIVPGREFYDYEDKYVSDGAELIAPAELPQELEDRLRRLSVEAFAALGGSGMARVDFLLERDGGLFLNEINTLPGFTDISMYPRLWALSGVPLPELTDRLVSAALDRHRDRRRLDDGIKAWLAELG